VKKTLLVGAESNTAIEHSRRRFSALLHLALCVRAALSGRLERTQMLACKQ